MKGIIRTCFYKYRGSMTCKTYPDVKMCPCNTDFCNKDDIDSRHPATNMERLGLINYKTYIAKFLDIVDCAECG